MSILVAVAVFFVIVMIQTLVRNMAFAEAISRPYNFFLAAIAFLGTFKAMSSKGENQYRMEELPASKKKSNRCQKDNEK